MPPPYIPENELEDNMAFDAFYLSFVLDEIRALGEARVEKIHQPSRNTVIVHLKGRETRAKLLIAADPAAPRSRPCSVCSFANTCPVPGWWR